MKSVNEGDKKQPAAEVKSWFSWTNDGLNNNVHSLQVLLEWLTTAENYNRLTGGAGQRGKMKQSIVVEIQNRIQESSIVVNRTTNSIIHKIKELVSSYKDAHQVKHRTGQGVIDKDKLDGEVYGICKYYDLLDPILGDRPAIKPRLINKQIINGEIDVEALKTGSALTSDAEEVEVVMLPVVSEKKQASSATAVAKMNNAKGNSKVIIILLSYVSLLLLFNILFDFITLMQHRKRE